MTLAEQHQAAVRQRMRSASPTRQRSKEHEHIITAETLATGKHKILAEVKIVGRFSFAVVTGDKRNDVFLVALEGERTGDRRPRGVIRMQRKQLRGVAEAIELAMAALDGEDGG